MRLLTLTENIPGAVLLGEDCEVARMDTDSRYVQEGSLFIKVTEDGVVMTGAGATYPYGNDPRDSNIRIAPTFPSNDELMAAMEVLVCCTKLAATKKLLGII